MQQLFRHLPTYCLQADTFNLALVCRGFEDIAERRMYDCLSNVDELRDEDPLHSKRLKLFHRTLRARPEITCGFKSVKLRPSKQYQLLLVRPRLLNVSSFTYVQDGCFCQGRTKQTMMIRDTMRRLRCTIEEANLSYAEMPTCNAGDRYYNTMWRNIEEIISLPHVE